MHKLMSCLALPIFVLALVACSDDGSRWGAIPCPDGTTGFEGPNGDLCIDEFEATNGEYAAFLTANGNNCGGANQECMHIDESGSYITQQGTTFAAAGGYENLPVVQVTFHGAEAYCTAASEFLCPDVMWVAACQGPGEDVYPYGDVYDGAACNGVDAANGAPVAVGSMASCEGGADGLFDMSGNVYEWTDVCGQGTCLIRGGSFDGPSDSLVCDASHEMDGPSGHREDLGLRCCASPL